MAIVRFREDKHEPYILVEIKESQSVKYAPKAKGVMGRIRNDIEKLDKVMKHFQSAYAITIFFFIKKYDGRHGRELGIPGKLQNDIKQEFEGEFGDYNVDFLFGPRKRAV